MTYDLRVWSIAHAEVSLYSKRVAERRTHGDGSTIVPWCGGQFAGRRCRRLERGGADPGAAVSFSVPNPLEGGVEVIATGYIWTESPVWVGGSRDTCSSRTYRDPVRKQV